MALIISNNIFSALAMDSDSAPSTPRKAPTPRKSPVNWGDISDDDDYSCDLSFPPIGSDQNADVAFVPDKDEDDDTQTVSMSDAEKDAWRQFNVDLRKVKRLNIEYTSRSTDPETKETTKKTCTRKVRMVSKNLYDSLFNLVNKFKTHRNDRCDYKEQKAKIKIANDLMEMAYKDPDVPACFVYAVANISLRDGRKIISNSVLPTSKSQFTVTNVSYFPPYSESVGAEI